MELKELGLQRINLDLNNNITENFFAKEGDIGSRGLSIKLEIDTTGITITLFARVGQEVYSVDAVVKDALKGSHDSYKIGDKVIFEGKVYKSIIDGNAWSPVDYPQGWEEV